MKKFLLLILVTSYSYSQIKVDNFNIEKSNSLPGQYIVMEFDNPNKLDLIKGLHLWASKYTENTDVGELPNKRGIYVIDKYDALPYGYLFQNKLGSRFVKPIEYHYEIEVKDNMVRVLLKDMRTSADDFYSFNDIRNSSRTKKNIPVKVDSTSLYLDVKLRDIKYQYSILGVQMMLNISNLKVTSLENYLKTYLEGEIFNDDGLKFEEVSEYSIDSNVRIFPYQYRYIEIDNLSAKDILSKIGQFNVSQSRVGEETFRIYHSYVNQESDYMIAKAYYIAPSNSMFMSSMTSSSFIKPNDYLNITFLYQDKKLYLAIDSFSESTDVFASETMVPKDLQGSTFIYNVKSIYNYTNNDDELNKFIENTSFKNSIWSGKFDANIIKLNRVLRKNGKERKSEIEKPRLFTNYMNYVFGELNTFINESSKQSSDW